MTDPRGPDPGEVSRIFANEEGLLHRKDLVELSLRWNAALKKNQRLKDGSIGSTYYFAYIVWRCGAIRLQEKVLGLIPGPPVDPLAALLVGQEVPVLVLDGVPEVLNLGAAAPHTRGWAGRGTSLFEAGTAQKVPARV